MTQAFIIPLHSSLYTSSLNEGDRYSRMHEDTSDSAAVSPRSSHDRPFPTMRIAFAGSPRGEDFTN